MSFLCKIGLHSWRASTKFIPSITARIVHEYIVTTKCANCGKQHSQERYVWDGEDFIEAKSS
jgi:hypothetical protein